VDTLDFACDYVKNHYHQLARDVAEGQQDYRELAEAIRPMGVAAFILWAAEVLRCLAEGHDEEGLYAFVAWDITDYVQPAIQSRHLDKVLDVAVGNLTVAQALQTVALTCNWGREASHNVARYLFWMSPSKSLVKGVAVDWLRELDQEDEEREAEYEAAAEAAEAFEAAPPRWLHVTVTFDNPLAERLPVDAPSRIFNKIVAVVTDELTAPYGRCEYGAALDADGYCTGEANWYDWASQ